MNCINTTKIYLNDKRLVSLHYIVSKEYIIYLITLNPLRNGEKIFLFHWLENILDYY